MIAVLAVMVELFRWYRWKRRAFRKEDRMLGQTSIAAATAIVGYDLAQDTFWRQSGRPRTLVAAGLCGSAAALDTKVRIHVGSNQVAEIFNSATGAPNRDAMFRIGAAVPGGVEVHAFVEDAPATNPINLAVDFQEH